MADYSVQDMTVIAEGSDMRFTDFTLAAGEVVPWHIHSQMADWYICKEGKLLIKTSPGPDYDLDPGGMCHVPPKTAHKVVNAGDGVCKFVIVQGVGAFDFIGLES